jgi:DNA-binding transcriptional LysR family regulator
VISEFLGKFPQVQLEVVLLNRRVDLVAEGFDVALRVRELGDEDPLLVTRRLRQAQMVVVASPAFVEGKTIAHPQDLKNLPVLGALEADRWCTCACSIAGQKRRAEYGSAPGHRRLYRAQSLRARRLGFTLLPMMYCEEELESGALVQLLPEWSLPGGWLQAVYPHRRG